MKKIPIFLVVLLFSGGCAELRHMNFSDVINESRVIKAPVKIYGQKPKIKIKSGKIYFKLSYKF